MSKQKNHWLRNLTHFDDVQFQKHIDGRANLVLEPVHLKVHTFENDLGPASVRDLLEDRRSLRVVQIGRREQNIELGRKKPKRSNVKLASLAHAAR
jgi:hypothetical protein